MLKSYEVESITHSNNYIIYFEDRGLKLLNGNKKKIKKKIGSSLKRAENSCSGWGTQLRGAAGGQVTHAL